MPFGNINLSVLLECHTGDIVEMHIEGNNISCTILGTQLGSFHVYLPPILPPPPPPFPRQLLAPPTDGCTGDEPPRHVGGPLARFAEDHGRRARRHAGTRHLQPLVGVGTV